MACKQQKFIFHSSEVWEVRDQGVSMSGENTLTSRFMDG